MLSNEHLRAPLRLSALAVLLAACGASATTVDHDTTVNAVEVSEAEPEAQPTDYLPADTFALLTIDVTRLRASPYYPAVVEALKGADEIPAEEEEQIHALVERTSKLWLAGVPDDDGTGADVGVVLIEGDYEPGQAEAALRGMMPSSAELREIEIAGHRVLDGGRGMLAEIDARHWLLGPSERVRPLLESPPGAFEAQNDAAWIEARQWLQRPDAGVTFIATGGPALHYELDRETPMDAATAESTRAVALSFDADEGVTLEAVALMSDPAVATEVIAWVQRQIDDLGQSMIAGMLGLGPVLQSVVAQAEGAKAGVRVQIPDAEIRRLLGLLPNLMAQ